jgi:hypothetical protein
MACFTEMRMKSRPASNIFRRSARATGYLRSSGYFAGFDA